MKASYTWLQAYFDTPLPEPEALAALFTKHVFEVESIEKVGDDTVFDFKILPDRAHYLLSHRGLAREASVITGLPLRPEPQDVLETAVPQTVGKSITVTITDENACRRYIAQEVSNIEMVSTSDWVRTHLEAIGQKSINLVVDIANCVMFDSGQPLHAFDADKINGDIVVRYATDGEKIILLTGEEVSLRPSDLVIADNDGPVAIAGVKGGKRAGVTDTTTRIIIEAANFDPVLVRKTSTRLNLRNDSSKRFENEITPVLATDGIRRMIHLLQKNVPQIQIGAQIDIYPKPVTEWTISVSASHINALIGISVDVARIQSILEHMRCYVSREDDMLHITPPLDRLDLRIAPDIADEIARIIGYEQLPSVLPPVFSEQPIPDKTFFHAERIKNMLVSRGYSETLLYSLVSKGVYEISYPLAKDKASLRETLLTKMSDALILNGRNADLLSLEAIKLFEIGKVFRVDGEKTMLAMGVLQVKKKKGITSEKILKDDLAALETEIGVPLSCDLTIGDFGAVAELCLDDVVTQLPDAQNIDVLAFSSLPKNKKYQPFSIYPFIVRDVAVFVPESVSETEVKRVILENVGPLCVQHYLFDVFQKKTDAGTRTSFAFRLIFQSFERTLEDTEVNSIMDGVYAAIAQQSGWEVR